MPEVTLEFIGKQLERVIADMASFRDDMRVLSAMVLRQDSTLGRLLDEVRAMHVQIQRIADRVGKLEEVER